MKLIESFKSPNFNSRKGNRNVIFLILHYTAMKSCGEAINYMCNEKNQASSHFLISKKGEIYHIVDLDKRAWHAGESYWKGLTDLNSSSIGIELDNSGYHINNENFDQMQIQSLCILLENLSKKYSILPENILGHSDIAPFRKIDPGEKFPWSKLYKRKLSYFPKIAKVQKNKQLRSSFVNKTHEVIIKMLGEIGYDIRNLTPKDKKFKLLIQAYQRHFRRTEISGKLDSETIALIKQHHKDLLT